VRDAASEVSGEREAHRGRSPWWREAATLLGVVGLLVTLAFNTVAVRQSARQDVEARETSQIGLLTDLNSNASDSERAINDTGAADKLCDPPEPLDDRSSAALLAGLDYYEYLAWLFNHRRVTVTGSHVFFAPRMIEGWRLGRHFYGGALVRDRYEELERFVRETPRGLRGDVACP
jgi:hypothetical protein